MKKQITTGLFAAVGVLLLIFDAQTALTGAREAVQLCISVIIPSLFPFFVLINLLSSTMQVIRFRPLERFLKIPAGSSGIFVSGLLGGYPTGAQLVHRSWKDGILQKDDAERMLCFCSNAGPAFIFGIVGQQFTDGYIPWLIWLIHIVSAVAVARIVSAPVTQRSTKSDAVTVSFTDALRRSVTVIAYVCGWVILFRIIAAFFTRWFLWLFPTEIQVALISILELANGCTALKTVENEGLRMIIATAALNFGGVCVAMQTASVTNGLKLSSYIKGKLLQTAVGICLCCGLQLLLPPDRRLQIDQKMLLFICALLPMIWYLAEKRKITVAFHRKLVYNGIRNKREG